MPDVEQAAPAPPAAPEKGMNGFPAEALTAEREGYSHKEPEKAAEDFTKYRKKFAAELHDRAERRARESFRQKTAEDFLAEAEEPPAMTPDQYFEWRKTGKVPESEQAEAAESEQGGESKQKATDPGEEILQSARTYGEQVEQDAKALLDGWRGNRTELQGLKATLALAQYSRDFPEIVKKLSEPFFSDARATREGQQRTKELQQDLGDVSNGHEVHLQLLRTPDAANRMAAMSREQRKQVVVDMSVGLKLNESRAAYENYDKIALPVAQQIARTHPAVAEAVGKAKYLGHMLYVIGQDPAHFLNLARTDPLGAVKQVAIYDHLIAQELGEKGGLQSLRGAGSAPVPLRKPTPAKQLTSAPPPPEEVGGKAQVAPDALEQALKDGDVGAYRRELNRQLRARARGY